ncbi:hypothetical protein COO60DRAFT_1643685 [Scenedesmus sp. NREL 46B-D3]|nr:hypothetical protein COO60DRAFT_1643685 [Scenedesmus sp. NREL 46B-D3]
MPSHGRLDQDLNLAPDAACQVTLRSLLFGFPGAAGQAYASFKCAHMAKSDFLSMLVYALGLLPSVGKVVLLLARGSTSTQLLAAGFRALYVATQFAARAVAWFADAWPQRSASVLHCWRNVLLVEDEREAAAAEDRPQDAQAAAPVKPAIKDPGLKAVAEMAQQNIWTDSSQGRPACM